MKLVFIFVTFTVIVNYTSAQRGYKPVRPAKRIVSFTPLGQRGGGMPPTRTRKGPPPPRYRVKVQAPVAPKAPTRKSRPGRQYVGHPGVLTRGAYPTGAATNRNNRQDVPDVPDVRKSPAAQSQGPRRGRPYVGNKQAPPRGYPTRTAKNRNNRPDVPDVPDVRQSPSAPAARMPPTRTRKVQGRPYRPPVLPTRTRSGPAYDMSYQNPPPQARRYSGQGQQYRQPAPPTETQFVPNVLYRPQPTASQGQQYRQPAPPTETRFVPNVLYRPQPTASPVQNDYYATQNAQAGPWMEPTTDAYVTYEPPATQKYVKYDVPEVKKEEEEES